MSKVIYWRLISLLVVALTALACQLDRQPSGALISGLASAIFRVGPDGRTVTLEGGAEISIPKGALTEELIIGFRSMEEPDIQLPPLPSGLRAVSPFYALTPHGQEFEKPVQMRLPHEATNHLQALALRLDGPEDDEWDPVSVGVKMAERFASVKTDHFSFYVIAEPIGGGSGTGTCGNGELDSGEACDDGVNDGSYGGCLPGCLAVASFCGDGVVDPATDEVCDPPSTCIQPDECGLVSGCNGARYEGSPEDCTGQCISGGVINACADMDGCCPDGCTAMEDDDCAACGNGRLEPGENCENDTEQPCPDSCDDGLFCTTDLLVNGDTCQAHCLYEAITTIDNGDGCCPPGANQDTDMDCSGACGNGVIDGEMGELCEPGVGSGCPTSCDDGNPCTIDLLSGSVENCNAACTHSKVTDAVDGDMCCPTGQTSNTDSDCVAVCGNNELEPGETCEPGTGMGCPASCERPMACVASRLTGDPSMCNLICSEMPISMAMDGDGCCPPGANVGTDSDCEASCGNGVIEPGEMCEPSLGAGCPTDCDDRDACTADSLSGSADNCTAACAHNPITRPRDGDGCCPASANESNDSDCNPICGNGAIEGAEVCEPGVGDGCPRSCDDQDVCTIDRLTGNPGSCNAACVFEQITTPANGDDCCPMEGNANNDSDCRPECGNGEVETGELCDGDCPTSAASCDDGDPCTRDVVTGTGCSRRCSHEPITGAANGDGCCPDAANANNDNDCSADCGNGVVESNETCDGDCPTSCNDADSCTTDRLAGTAANCNVRCIHDPITSPANADGCCPGSGNANNDSDCSADCGNGVVEPPTETCEPGVGAGCPTCNDGDPCTTDAINGSPSTCNVTCARSPVTAVESGDGCCPNGAIFSQDNDCPLQCGDGIIDTAAGETCEPDVGAGCFTTDAQCDVLDNGCGRVVNGGTCSATCTQISGMVDGDGCCPPNADSTVDRDCRPICGNGVVETGERCDGAGCPRVAADCGSDRCVDFAITGSAQTCDAECTSSPKGPNPNERDGCCPGEPGQFNANQDLDCAPVCGNGTVEPGETCDTASMAGCPNRDSCEVQEMCQTGMFTGSGCTAQCTPLTVTALVDGDGCCPAGASAAQDSDCMGCGNGMVEDGETCDGNCQQSCNDGDVCTLDQLTGSPASCDVVCNFTPLDFSGRRSDDCCPSGGAEFQDVDCPAECGNGFVESGESCEPQAADPGQRCPTAASCDDGDVCTIDGIRPEAEGNRCTTVCTHQPRTPNPEQDGCCPANGNSDNDPDCLPPPPVCGNGQIDEGELCDPRGTPTCPLRCIDTDEDPCTVQELLNPDTCQAQCRERRIIDPGPADRCCPDGATPNTDPDCVPPAPTCGNGVLESGELCELDPPPGTPVCPTGCPDDGDGNACTILVLVDRGTCQARCEAQTITESGPSDGCCPGGGVDPDCAVVIPVDGFPPIDAVIN